MSEGNANSVIKKNTTSVPAWLLAFALCFSTVIVYLPATQCGFIWDDDGYIENNSTLGGVDGLSRIWFEFGATQDYYPLTFSTFWLEWWLWEFRPLGYHLVNILLHAANALLLWRLLVRLGVPGALLAALLFAVHPVHVESVAWVTERKNVLSGLFCLLSLHAFVRFARLDEPPHVTGWPRWKCYALSVSAFLLAMLAKTVVIPLPLALPILVWWKRGWLERRDLFLVAPYFLVVAPLFVVAFVEKSNFAGAGVNILVAEGAEWQLSLLQRVLLCGRVVWFYTAKLFWPHPLIFIYPRWQIDSTIWWQYLYPLAAAALLVILWRLRNRIGRGPLAAALLFGLMLGPASGLLNFYFQKYSYVADHLQYLASIALITLFAAMVTQVTKTNRAYRIWSSSLVISILLILSAVSWRQQSAYRNQEALWRDTLAKKPACWMSHNNLGFLLLEQDLYQEAANHLREALRLDPTIARAHFNLSVALNKQRRYQEAEKPLRKTLRLDPEHAKAHHNLSTFLLKQGRDQEAETHLREALRLDPKNAKTHHNLGTILLTQGQYQEAETHLRDALRLNPDYASAHCNLGVILLKQGQYQEAETHLRDTLRRDPDYASAHHNLGVALTNQGQHQEAANHLRKALRLDPEHTTVHHILGTLLLENGQYQEAAIHLREAIRFLPEFATAHGNLGLLLLKQGQYQEAETHLREALRLDPDYAKTHHNLGALLLTQGQYQEAVKHLREAINLSPNMVSALNDLAWIYATHPRSDLRNAVEAVRLAEQACQLSGRKIPAYLDTLAAAYAEAGRFAEAVTTAEKAIQLAGANGHSQLAAQIQAHLDRYQQGRPYRQGVDSTPR